MGKILKVKPNERINIDNMSYAADENGHMAVADHHVHALTRNGGVDIIGDERAAAAPAPVDLLGADELSNYELSDEGENTDPKEIIAKAFKSSGMTVEEWNADADSLEFYISEVLEQE